METTLRQQAECYLGTAIEPSEWDKAKDSAERKLKSIIEREGDANGARHEQWYLAQLIAETVKSNRFSQFALELAAISRYADEAIRDKKRAALPNGNGNSLTSIPIVSHN